MSGAIKPFKFRAIVEFRGFPPTDASGLPPLDERVRLAIETNPHWSFPIDSVEVINLDEVPEAPPELEPRDTGDLEPSDEWNVEDLPPGLLGSKGETDAGS